jgi:hypothetical protein
MIWCRDENKKGVFSFLILYVQLADEKSHMFHVKNEKGSVFFSKGFHVKLC